MDSICLLGEIDRLLGNLWSAKYISKSYLLALTGGGEAENFPLTLFKVEYYGKNDFELPESLR